MKTILVIMWYLVSFAFVYVLIDALFFGGWVLSNQYPPHEGFYLGMITAKVLGLFI